MNPFQIDKQQVRRAFSRAAADYDAAAVLQREVCQRMLQQLDFIKLKPSHLLDVGSGTGWGTQQLASRYPQAKLTSLDIALGMLQHARRSSRSWKTLFSPSRQTWLCADVEQIPLANASINMVWSNLALQWCNDLPATFVELNRILSVEGLLIFSSFGVDTLHELRHAFKDVDGYNHLNRFADLHDVGDMLVAAGFADPVMEMERITLTYNDVRAVMQDLKSIGANNATSGRANGMMGKTTWQRVIENYEMLRVAGKLPATFEIIYGHAWKPAPKINRDGHAIIKTNFKL
jgi:malonyl-CoA O-methyltransferase